MDLLKLMEIMTSDRPSYLLSFFFACALSQFPGNSLVYWLHVCLVRRKRPWLFVKKRPSTQEIIGYQPEHDTIGALIIGWTERPLYIFAIMFAQPGVITAVIILKAFFNWTQVFTEPSLASDPGENRSAESIAAEKLERMRRAIAHYHAYVLGNLISLALGLMLGEVGVYAFPSLFSRLLRRARVEACRIGELALGLSVV
jgi:hypothetical protein